MVQTIAEYGNQTGGLESTVVYLSNQIPSLAPGLLFLIFMVIAIAGYSYEKRKNVTGNMLMWMSISSFITTSLAFILFLYPGIINLYVLGICFFWFCMLTLIFFTLDQKNSLI